MVTQSEPQRVPQRDRIQPELGPGGLRHRAGPRASGGARRRRWRTRRRPARGQWRSSGGSSRPFTPQRQSADDAKRVQLLTAEVRNPPAFLTIADSGGAITFTSDPGETRTFHPGRGREALHFGDLPVSVTARWEEDRLIVVYDAEEGHQLRYHVLPTADPRRLRIDVQFVERGGGDLGRAHLRPRDRADADNGQRGRRPTRRAPPPPSGSVPAAAGGATAIQPPGSELKGLSGVGVVVEDLDGNSRGVRVEPRGDRIRGLEGVVECRSEGCGECRRRHLHLRVNVMTTTMATGFCASRTTYRSSPTPRRRSLSIEAVARAGGAAAQRRILGRQRESTCGGCPAGDHAIRSNSSRPKSATPTSRVSARHGP